MKRLLIFVIVCICLVITFLYSAFREKNYNLDYEFKEYKIHEEYNKENKIYYFSVVVNDVLFDYNYELKYTRKRKLVKNVNVKENDNQLCVSLSIDNVKTKYICYKNKEYVDSYIGNIDTVKEAKVKKKYKKVKIYNSNYDYYVWNGYGITNIETKKNYKFLKKESYDNLISFKNDKYILFADYDADREFNKLYVFNKEKDRIDTWEFVDNISFNSYFMGEKDDHIYLFDKKNKIQYKLNVDDRTIEICSDNYGGVFYDNEWTKYTYNKLIYNDLTFNYTYPVNYFVDNDKLYYKFQDSKNRVLSSKNRIDSIVYRDSDAIYYLSDDYLYRYSILTGEEVLLNDFEWNFSSINKIFIFD